MVGKKGGLATLKTNFALKMLNLLSVSVALI